MMKLRKYFLFMLLVPLFSGCLNIRLRTANEYYEQFAYARAAEEYEYVLSRRTDEDAIVKVADCYRQMGNSSKTEHWYRRAIRTSIAQPVFELYLAEAMMRNGRYEDAAKTLGTYLDLNKDDYKAQRMLFSCQNPDEFNKDTSLYTIDVLDINTPGNNYFSPAFYRSGIVFLSDRSVKGLSRATSDGTGQRYLDLFYARRTDKGHWFDPEPLRGDVNGKFNEGPVVFTNDFNTMYFTRNNYLSNRAEKNLKNVNVLKIFKADFKEGIWTIGEPLPFNAEEFSTGHPALSRDGASIYFISDMPWGYGGTDIYRVQWLGNGQWSAPQNLGTGINTEGNELFPFILNDSILYYASDGHTGLGGLDVFESRFRDGAWSKAENLGVPVNSSADDFSFIADSTGNKGYFTSVRNGVNDQIFSFEKHPPQLILELKVADAKSGTPVSQARITLSSSVLPETTLVSSATGLLRLPVQPGTNYRLQCDHPDYFMVKTEASTYGKKFSETISLNVEMRKVQLNTPFAWQGITFRKKDLNWRPASVDALNSLAELLKNNPRLLIDVESYTDSRGQDAENLMLTQQRADLVRQFLIDQGINEARLTAKGYGEVSLVNKCTDGVLCLEEDHERNNRIEITIRSIIKDSSLP